jgi:outer membrane protein OmpA-like peptidoglycan-associated protein
MRAFQQEFNLMATIRKKSAWSFKTSGGGSESVSVYGPIFVTGSAGLITLTSPQGRDVKFHMAAGGAGAGLALPSKFKKINGFISPKFSASGSSEAMYSAGDVYVLDGFSGAELTADDFEGWFITHDVSAGAILAGFSGTVMLLGLAATSIPFEVLKDGLVAQVINKIWPSVLGSKAKALLLMKGQTAGSIGAGVANTVGYMWADGRSSKAPAQSMPNLDVPTIETTTTRSALASQDEADVIRLPGDALFAFDRYDIRPAAEATLLQVAALIRQRSPRSLSVEGHTDAIGNAGYNFMLSDHRANAVKRWLVNRNVMTASAIQTKGWGELKPVAPNTRADRSDDPQGRQKNRRVEIWLIR